MNILYLGMAISDKDYGGNVIRKRNIKLVERLDSNCKRFFFINYRNMKISYFHTLFGFTSGITFFTNHKIKKILKENNISNIYIDGSDYCGLSKSILRKNNLVVFFHNVEYNYRKASKHYRNPIKKFFFLLRVRNAYRSEKNICKYAKSIITLNERDSKELERLYGRKSDIIWPTTFEDKYDKSFQYDNSEHFLLFVGFDFFGNTDGLFWFIENCMPHINHKLIIAGKGMDKYKSKYDLMNVEFLGYVEDLSKLYYNADAVVLPIISGSGMKTKTCEALMYGKKIFGTEEAFQGYDGIENTDCVLCKTAEDFVSTINLYMENQDNVNVYSDNVRQLYLDKFTEEKELNKMQDFLGINFK